MTVPRGEIFDAGEVGTYHCISRCVRRAFLCGYDQPTHTSYEHRRVWIRDRLTFLIQIFAIDLVSYAVMSNHLHSVIRNRPDLAARWTPREVARRWRRLFPRRMLNGAPAEPTEEEIGEIIDDHKLVARYRKRLSSISWFNRCICEVIARRANREDKCTGRFWEGRFKSQRVNSTAGLVACSAYVDLNPIRARLATTPEESDFTSVQDRIRRRTRRSDGVAPTPALVSIEEVTDGDLSTDEYLALVDTTGRLLVAGKGRIPDDLAPILVRLRINPNKWLDTTTNYRHRFRRVVGPAVALAQAAQKIGKSWLHGMTSARLAFS